MIPGKNKNKESPESLEKPEDFVQHESSCLENLGGKFRKFSHILTLATTISVICFVSAQEASAQKTNISQKQELKDQSKIDWAFEAMNKLNNDANKLKTAEDVAVFERLIIKPFVYNIGMMSEGKEVKSNYSMEEYEEILSCVKTIEKKFEEIEEKFNVTRSGGVYNNIEYLKKILTMRTSYSGFHEYKGLYNLE